MSEPTVKIYKQKRNTMMLRPVPGGVEVYIPHTLRKNSRQVKQFIQMGLRKVAAEIPPVPPERTSRQAILAMVEDYAARIGVQPTRVQMRDMRRKWGSCSSKGTVTLNTRLTWLQKHLVEYIVCHELVHLMELNHSQRFWGLLAQHMPDYKTRLDELRRVEKTLW
jgi:predicted metal-dependent hydrolase